MSLDLPRADWRKSSRSQSQSQCVELAVGSDATGIRDTKNRDGGTLRFAAGSYETFVGAVKAGKLDHQS